MKYPNNHIEDVNERNCFVNFTISQQYSGTSSQWKSIRKRNEAYILRENIESFTKNYITSLEQNQEN